MKNLWNSESLRPLCSYQIGGQALLAAPHSREELTLVLNGANQKKIPVQPFGWGTNLLFPDHPEQNRIFLTTRNMNEFRWTESGFYAGAGFPLTMLGLIGAALAESRYDFCYLLPGSAGGAIYINARCYEAEIAGILHKAEYIEIDNPGIVKTIPAADCGFHYKESVFQTRPWILTGGYFHLREEPSEKQKAAVSELIRHWKAQNPDLSELSSFYQFSTGMKAVFDKLGLNWPKKLDDIDQDRTSKQHFSWPSCGSVFKNDRALGKPTGALIDALGLKGAVCGGAAVSPCHGNIIINRGNATSRDVNSLIGSLSRAMANAYGHSPEVEVVIYEPLNVSEGKLRV